MSLIFSLFLQPINDITTSFESPPAFVEIQKLPAHKGKSLDYNRSFEATQKERHPEIAPLRLSKSPSEVFSSIEQLARAQSGWTIVSSDLAQHRLEAVATTALLKFKDDVVIEVRKAADGCEVHMRSRSRVGKSDLGANAKRISAFLKALNDQFR